ncbi:MBL fold metallo-hydrolase RNA specificity domain-containing protein [Bremerella sp. T1]|uniref:MBL fold metallo-hydrolase RNA specificity domain-containing protein n=1 Tax=Bremerella sp. TYQ1 TaxID=3119568 RepID=UPI001CCC2966|nr:MBL fold metallo-hydrolase [Bremerella volcania]UBM36251.1 MBL fold metallo-hydrolase [Bremerella volcania]
MTRLTFHGAAETVTGSKYLLEADGTKVLIDCGLFQGLKELRKRNWDPLPFTADSLDRIILTHAHIDHTGYLPRIVKDGYHGPILCTPGTKRLAELLLLDSAENQERDAEYFNYKGISSHKPALPLYDPKDARKAIQQLKAKPRSQWHQAAGPIWYRFHDAGHLLGSNMIEVEVRNQDPPLRLLFSGDVGRYDAPLYHDPHDPPRCDFLICESTYGNRDHPDGNVLDSLEMAMNDAIERGGVILMASFAVGRAQQLIYLLQVLMHDKRIPEIPIYLDSPMAVDATEIFRDFSEDHDLAEGRLDGRDSVLNAPNVHMVRSSKESKELNKIKGPAVIIASSGMMTGGRILFHLRQRLPWPQNTVLAGGFMAAGTLGRRMQEGEKTVRIHKRDVPVNAHLESISGLSGHAGQSELMQWVSGLPKPKLVFLTHGEPESASVLSGLMRQRLGFRTIIPRMGESFELEEQA